MNRLFTSGGQSIRASASVLPMYHTVLETQWAAIWTEKPGVLLFMGSPRVGNNLVIEQQQQHGT